MPLQDDYQVTLETFEGPLDLLLYLMRRAEVDIHDIPIAQITEQYLGFLKQIDEIDIDLAGDFLVMASTLIEIKSRTLMPPEPADVTDGQVEAGVAEGAAEAALAVSDPRSQLVRQLLEYRRYHIAADELAERRAAFAHRFALRPYHGGAESEAAAPVELDLEDAHIFDLVESYEHIMASIDFRRFGDHLVEIDHTPIAVHQEDLLERLKQSPGGQLLLVVEIFEGHDRGQRLGLFLAMLELVRLLKITVRQEAVTDEIVLELLEERREA